MLNNTATVWLQERVLLKPMMKLVGNMHGNEAVGRELLLALATLILRDHEQDRAANEGSRRFHNHGEDPY